MVFAPFAKGEIDIAAIVATSALPVDGGVPPFQPPAASIHGLTVHAPWADESARRRADQEATVDVLRHRFATPGASIRREWGLTSMVVRLGGGDAEQVLTLVVDIVIAVVVLAALLVGLLSLLVSGLAAALLFVIEGGRLLVRATQGS